MLIISKATANKLNVVCDDILTLTDPVYLWRFVNKTTQIENLIELENQLPSNPRFDQFNLTLPTDLDLESGEYEWYVYVEEITTDGNGQQVGRPVSDVSDTLSFLWQ